MSAISMNSARSYKLNIRTKWPTEDEGHETTDLHGENLRGLESAD